MILGTSAKSGSMLVTKKKKIDRGGTIGCEIIVLRRGCKKADILSVNNFCLILNNRRTGQSYNIFCLRLFDTWDK